MRNIQDGAPIGRPGTLRLRRNYGLRSPGNPLPPHRNRGALPPSGASFGAGPDLQRRPGAARTRHDRFRRRSNATMLVLKRLAALTAVMMAGLVIGDAVFGGKAWAVAGQPS